MTVDLMNVSIYGDELIVREETIGDCRNRFFIKVNSDKAIHVSNLLRDSIFIDIIRGRVEYTIPRARLPDSFELVEVSNCDHPFIKVYHVRDSAINVLDTTNNYTLVFTTSSARVDELVNEITSYREYWSSNLCRSTSFSSLYRAFLIADTSFNYNITRRLKETWLELASEYMGFLLALLHSIILGIGYEIATENSIEDKCKRVSLGISNTWKETTLVYYRGTNTINIYLEKMIHGVTPDILVSNSESRLVIESKQGPVENWLEKAIKQSKKYREVLKGKIALVTNRRLDQPHYNRLSKYYDAVIPDCNLAGLEVCKSLISSLIVSMIKT